MGNYTKEIALNEFLDLVLENGPDFIVEKHAHYFGNDYTITFNNLKQFADKLLKPIIVTVTLGHVNTFRIEKR